MAELTAIQQFSRSIRYFSLNVYEAARFVSSASHRQFVKRMETPVFGDLIVRSVNNHGTADEDDLKAIGHFIEQGDDEALVQTLDGKEERWRSGQFYAVPGERKPGSVVELHARAREFAVELEPCSANHLAKVTRFFGHNSYGRMISLSGKSFNVYQRMTYPQRGDLVIEYTTAFRSEENFHLDAVGFLIEEGATGDRFCPECPTRVKTLDGREVFWTNASFLAIPAEPVIENQPQEEERY